MCLHPLTDLQTLACSCLYMYNSPCNILSSPGEDLLTWNPVIYNLKTRMISVFDLIFKVQPLSHPLKLSVNLSMYVWEVYDMNPSSVSFTDFFWCTLLTRMKLNTRGRYSSFLLFYCTVRTRFFKQLYCHCQISHSFIHPCKMVPPRLGDLLILTFAMAVTKL